MRFLGTLSNRTPELIRLITAQGVDALPEGPRQRQFRSWGLKDQFVDHQRFLGNELPTPPLNLNQVPTSVNQILT